MLCFGWNKTAAQTGPYCAQSLGCIIPVEAFLSFFFLQLSSIPLLFSLARADGNGRGLLCAHGESRYVRCL